MKFLVILLIIVGGIYYQYSHAIISLIDNSDTVQKEQTFQNNIENADGKFVPEQNNKNTINSQKSQEILETYFKNSQENNKISDEKIEQNILNTDLVLSDYLDSISPVEEYQISSYFGSRLQASKNYSYDFHRGIDYHHAENVNIYAIADGEIYKTYLESDPNNPYKNSGTTLIIKHTLTKPYKFHGKNTNTIYSYYTHLSEINNDFFEEYGKKINKGEIVGFMGSSGTTDYQHLHFEIRVATTCSREYQLKNPKSNCSKILPNNADPHINPLIFLPQKVQNNNYNVSKIQNLNSLTLNISTLRDTNNFNTIIIEENGNQKIVDFNTRLGIDSINIDNNYFKGIKILPAQFSTRSNQYEISFEFENFTSQADIYIFDTFGNQIH